MSLCKEAALLSIPEKHEDLKMKFKLGRDYPPKSLIKRDFSLLTRKDPYRSGYVFTILGQSILNFNNALNVVATGLIFPGTALFKKTPFFRDL